MNYEFFKLNIQDGIAAITFDTPNQKANILSAAALTEFNTILDEICVNKAIKIATISSAKPDIFIAGADISEIKNLHTTEDALIKVKRGQDVLTKITTLPFPTIAVIDGACMGGGAELALCCTYRVVTDSSKAKIALPEVNLGILPGFGGTQRLPILIGIPKALDMMLTGRSLSGKNAFKSGLVDALFPKQYLDRCLNDFIVKTLKSSDPLHPKRQLKSLSDKILSNILTYRIAIAQAKRSVTAKVGKHYPAPFAILNVLSRTYKHKNIHTGLIIEREAFSKLVIDNVCKNLIDLYYTNEDLKKEYPSNDTSMPNQVLLLGAGVMGGGIAWLFINSNIRTRMKDITWNAISIGYKQVGEIFNKLVKSRKVQKYEMEKDLNCLTSTIKEDGLNNVDFVVEAVIEDLKIKQQIVADLQQKLPTNTIIATNTSSLTLRDISSQMHDKSRFVGMHFFNPVNKMPLVEVIKGPETSEEAVQKVVAISRKTGKTPIVVGDCNGFVVNRMLLPYMNEALACLEQGATIEQIDKLFLNFGMPMGPFRLADEVGLDVCYKVSKNLEAAYAPRATVSPTIEKMYKTDHLLGKKANLGFYIYKNNRPDGINANIQIDKKTSTPLDESKILDRCLFIMINEAATIIEDKILTNPAYIDMSMIMGTGFPAFRGGILKYADHIGISKVVEGLQSFQSLYGPRFQPAKLLVEMAQNNQRFYQTK